MVGALSIECATQAAAAGNYSLAVNIPDYRTGHLWASGRQMTGERTIVSDDSLTGGPKEQDPGLAGPCRVSLALVSDQYLAITAAAGVHLNVSLALTTSSVARTSRTSPGNAIGGAKVTFIGKCRTVSNE